MNLKQSLTSGPVGVASTVLRYAVLIISGIVAVAVTHDLLYLMGQSVGAFVLAIPFGVLLARWVQWARSIVAPPAPSKVAEATTT